MVRGQKARTMVSYSEADDCCSPISKRRGKNGAFNAKVLEATNPSKTAISAFCHAISVDMNHANKPLNGKLIDNGTHLEEFAVKYNHQKMQNKDGAIDTVIKCPTTPLNSTTMESRQLTPHRIELCIDQRLPAIDDPAKQIILEVPEKKLPKGRRRLNIQLDAKNLIKNNLNHKLTEYFPVRRSVRKTKKTVLEEKQRSMEQLLRNGIEEGLEIKQFDGKGRGVVAARSFSKGDFVVEYSGDLIDISEAKQRELKYAQDQNTGCYMYYFKHNDQQYCIDATAETGRLGRLVNHSRNGNLLTKTVLVDNNPHLVLLAKDDIKEGDEITYDYGDRSKESLIHHPWLAY